MKVIVRGTPPENTPVRIDCQQCASVLECNRSELAFVPDEKNGAYWTCKCPVCDGTVVARKLTPAEEAQPAT